MSKLLTKYKLVQEGRMPKGEFLRQARQEFPGYLSNQNSYEDSVSILRSKGLLSEAVYQNVADKFPLEVIEKGIKIELESMGYEDYRNASVGDYKKAKSLVIDHLVKDPLYYLPVGKHAEDPKYALGVLGESRRPKKVRTNLQERLHKTLHKAVLREAEAVKYEDNPKVKEADSKFSKEIQERTPKAMSLTRPLSDRLPSVHSIFRNIRNEYPEYVEPLEDTMKQCKLTWTYDKNDNKILIQKLDYDTFPDAKKADSLLTGLLNASKDGKGGKTTKDGRIFQRTPQECLVAVQKKFPRFTRPLRITMKNYGLTWEDVPGTGGEEKKLVYKGKNWRKSGAVYKEGKENKESKLLREAVKKLVVKVLSENKEKKILSEAATANLAQLSDQNATIQGLPAILNNLENVVTEIESFALKETTKIQGIFDSIGNIKNEDGMPIGYQFAQPILDSFSKDLQPVLEKMDFVGSINLPAAPQMTAEPNLENPNNPEAPEEKQTVFTPKPVAAPALDDKQLEPLAENKAPKRRYTV